MAEGTPVSPVTADKPELIVSEPRGEKMEPVELDSSPISPRELLQRRGSKGDALSNLSPAEREQREKTIAERRKDAAVIVQPPNTPGAEEFSKSKDAEGDISKSNGSGSA